MFFCCCCFLVPSPEFHLPHVEVISCRRAKRSDRWQGQRRNYLLPFQTDLLYLLKEKKLTTQQVVRVAAVST